MLTLQQIYNTNKYMNKIFTVNGMSCAACAAHVDKAIRRVDGVREVNVNLLMNQAQVDFDEQQCSPADLKKAVDDMGFELIIDAPKTVHPTSSIYQEAFFLLCSLIIYYSRKSGYLLYKMSCRQTGRMSGTRRIHLYTL